MAIKTESVRRRCVMSPEEQGQRAVQSALHSIELLYHHCTLLGCIRAHSSLIWLISLIWHTITIEVMIYSGI